MIEEGVHTDDPFAPNTVPYMYIRGIGMIGPSPSQRCDNVARIGPSSRAWGCNWFWEPKRNWSEVSVDSESGVLQLSAFIVKLERLL